MLSKFTHSTLSTFRTDLKFLKKSYYFIILISTLIVLIFFARFEGMVELVVWHASGFIILTFKGSKLFTVCVHLPPQYTLHTHITYPHILIQCIRRFTLSSRHVTCHLWMEILLQWLKELQIAGLYYTVYQGGQQRSTDRAMDNKI